MALLARAGLRTPDECLTSRRLAIDDDSGFYRFIFVKPADGPVYVEHGIADCGIVGGVAVTPDGTRVYMANTGDGTVSVIDTASNTVTATIPVGSFPTAFGQFIGPIRFSDKHLGGITSGAVLSRDAGITLAFADATPNAGNGVTVTVTGPPTGTARLKLDGKSANIVLAPGTYILIDPPATTTVQVISGEATVEVTFQGTTIQAVIEPGETASIIETIVDGIVTEVDVEVVEGTITVNGTSIAPGETLDLPVVVDIDIKPGGFPNAINPNSKGVLPVAILSTASFNAATQVDRTSLTFGRTGNEGSLRFCQNPADVNGDGRLDLLCHFSTQQADFQTGNTVGILRGKLTNGLPIRGQDSVKIVPKG